MRKSRQVVQEILSFPSTSEPCIFFSFPFLCTLANCHLDNSHNLKIFWKDPCLVPRMRTWYKSFFFFSDSSLLLVEVSSSCPHLLIVQAQDMIHFPWWDVHGCPTKGPHPPIRRVWLSQGRRPLGMTGYPARVSTKCTEIKQQFNFLMEINAPFLF